MKSDVKSRQAQCRLWRKATQKGFTLIEIMVAMVIMAIIGLMSWRALDTLVRTREYVIEKMDAINSLSRGFSQLEYDAFNIASLEKVSRPFIFQANQLILTRQVGSSQMGNQFQVIRYRIDKGNWVREVSPIIRTPQGLSAILQSDNYASSVILAKAVNAIDIAAWSPQTGWSKDINAVYSSLQPALSSLPMPQMQIGSIRSLGLEIRVSVEGQKFPFRRVVLLGI